MGKVLEEFYEFMKNEGGVHACMRLALKTRLTSTAASQAQDTPELIELFRESIREILGKLPPE